MPVRNSSSRIRRICNSGDDVCGLKESRPVALGQKLFEQLAVDFFKCDVTDLVDVAGVEYGDDVRMMQPSGRLGLAHERLFNPFVRGAIAAL